MLSGAPHWPGRTGSSVDLQPAKLELDRAFGATDVIDPSGTDAVAAVKDLTGGGATLAFEVVPASTARAPRST